MKKLVKGVLIGTLAFGLLWGSKVAYEIIDYKKKQVQKYAIEDSIYSKDCYTEQFKSGELGSTYCFLIFKDSKDVTLRVSKEFNDRMFVGPKYFVSYNGLNEIESIEWITEKIQSQTP
ncbi:hypothetical protein [Brevibacillus reuszeri]|uniref:hypothetical protein n=1 Tax=Brevibacillus reuszeri TaxID=54915 RepID=UPI000CCC6FFD|nr:hypothetical protein [Brevibacillus reuszeri]